MVIFLNKIMASCSNIRIVHMTDDWRSKSIPDPKVMFLAHNTGQNASQIIYKKQRKKFNRTLSFGGVHTIAFDQRYIIINDGVKTVVEVALVLIEPSLANMFECTFSIALYYFRSY